MFRVARKICDPPIKDINEASSLSVRSRWQFETAGSEKMEKYVSPSFLPVLKDLIPRDDIPLGFGGCWFWGCYFHGLYGEDMVVDLGGTGVSLSEDSLDAQVTLRRKFSSNEGEFDGAILEHCCSKLEALCALCLSVVLHVARQPMLEDGDGPQALVLCATKDQCDEIYTLVDRFGSHLHLVTHNLFGAYPPMPTGRRADIVVGTLPLWEGVAKLTPRDGRDGLEEILYCLPYDTSRSTSSTRWRPYSLDFVTQLLLIDLDLQCSLGYWPLLQRLFCEEKKPRGPVSRHPGSKDASNRGQGMVVRNSVLCNECQVYCLVDGSGKGAELFVELLSSRSCNHALDNMGSAFISLGTGSLSPKTENRAIVGQCATKRPREHCSYVTANTKQTEGYVPRLEVHNAFSHSRLLADATAFDEFADETIRCALSFWSRFERSQPTGDGGDVSSVVNVSLAYVCVNSCIDFENGKSAWFVSKTVAVITPTDHAAAHASRVTLLMQHLVDELSGQIFDGSVLQCFHRFQHAECVDPLDVVLGRVFSATAKSLLQEPTFISICSENVNVDVVAPVAHLGKLREAVVRTSSMASESPQFPLYKFIGEVTQQPWYTVLVFRNIESSSFLFCETPGGAKPTALLYLEECCQYGKVISFFVYQRATTGVDAEEGVDFFVEFQTREGAAEAVRRFALRFWADGPQGKRIGRVKLFPNELYYEGVGAEIRKLSPVSGECDAEDEALDSGDDFLNISLLAER